MSARGVRLGAMLIFTGFVKKLLIADGIAPITDGIFGKVALGQEVSSGDLLIGAYLFTFQIYGDFRGYSDAAAPKEELPIVDRPIWFAVTIAAFVIGLYLAPPLASQSFVYFQF